jgi:hypothetical protein
MPSTPSPPLGSAREAARAHVLEGPILARGSPAPAARRRRPARKRPAAAQPSRTAIETSKSHPDAEERKKARRSLHALERRSLQAASRSFLEQGSVSRTVQQQYKAALDRFVKDQSIRDLYALARTPKALDQKLKFHLDELYFEGELSGVANTLVAAIRWKFPQFGRQGGQSLPETARALMGFSKLSPAASRLRIPATVVFGLAMVLCSLGFTLAAFEGSIAPLSKLARSGARASSALLAGGFPLLPLIFLFPSALLPFCGGGLRRCLVWQKFFLGLSPFETPRPSVSDRRAVSRETLA